MHLPYRRAGSCVDNDPGRMHDRMAIDLAEQHVGIGLHRLQGRRGDQPALAGVQQAPGYQRIDEGGKQVAIVEIGGLPAMCEGQSLGTGVALLGQRLALESAVGAWNSSTAVR